MKIRLISGLVLTGLLATGAALADCDYPRPPSSVPDGATATEEEMVAGMKSVKAYNEAVTAYLSCLEQEMNEQVEAAGPDAPPAQIEQIKAIHTKRHNAAVEELEAHAARFNEQVRIFKSRDKS
jgi:hypothetical protein